MFENCVTIRSHFSDYVDGLCTPEETRSIRYHLKHCAACGSELELAETVTHDLCHLPLRGAPEEASLRTRVRISQELHRPTLGALGVRLDNALRSLLLPASGGLVTALVSFVLIMGVLVLPAGRGPDVPVSIMTPARVLLLSPMDFNTGDNPVVIVTRVDAEGHAIDYRVLSGQSSPELIRHLDRMIFFSQFMPATFFGKPTEGEVVLALRQITVRG